MPVMKNMNMNSDKRHIIVYKPGFKMSQQYVIYCINCYSIYKIVNRRKLEKLIKENKSWLSMLDKKKYCGCAHCYYSYISYEAAKNKNKLTDNLKKYINRVKEK